MAVKKTKTPKEKVSETPAKEKAEKYFYAVGRRKTSVAQVRLVEREKAAEGDCLVNKKKVADYFPGDIFQEELFVPIKTVGLGGKCIFTIVVKGGGFKGQAEASRLGIARALVKYDESFRKPLRDLGLLTRDSREVERKKPGLKKARRAPQWAKR